MTIYNNITSHHLTSGQVALRYYTASALHGLAPNYPKMMPAALGAKEGLVGIGGCQ